MTQAPPVVAVVNTNPDLVRIMRMSLEKAGFVVFEFHIEDIRLGAADVDSLSGKAKKARGYGIPIMSIDQFRQALDYPPPAAGASEYSNWGDSERQWAKALREERI